MKKEKIFLKDYRPPDYFILKTHLYFELNEEKTVVTQVSEVCRNQESADLNSPLILAGENLKLLSFQIDGKDFLCETTQKELKASSVPKKFEMKIVTEIEPQNNKALIGLYRSQKIFCTQCEANGFRRITYFVDRPDNMAMYTTTISADKKKYPILLSNGNLVEKKDIEDGRHSCTWNDPFKKPSYLFALVAGDLECLEDTFITMSGRKVDLRIYVELGRKEQCHHAMKSLKESMKWDEEKFSREYDLDLFMIVAIDDFNMGAMENKGLNIFNSKCILADEKTATDSQFESIAAVVAHEYFHNWTGNRITCRDWFQLSLKEGLTVYRDQEFTADQTSRTVKRINDVVSLRATQFAEDAGPNAHPVRPFYCYSVDNFYTSTIYSKGAELIRMMAVILGEKNFKKGMDKYFELYDGKAVTCDDFVYALEQASGVDFTQFKRWYVQSGTPQLDISSEYDSDNKTFILHINQSCSATPEQPTKENFQIPLTIGLLDSEGNGLPIDLGQEKAIINSRSDEVTLNIFKKTQSFTFKNVDTAPIPSLLRNFSAPVKLKYNYSPAELSLLMSCDKNDFSRWEAGQIYANRIVLEKYKNGESSEEQSFIDSMKFALKESARDPLLFSYMLSLPTYSFLEQFLDKDLDPQKLHFSLASLKSSFGKFYSEDILKIYESMKEKEFSASQASIGKRSLKNECLSLLIASGEDKFLDLAVDDYKKSNNMTDSLEVLVALKDKPSSQKDFVMNDFYETWRKNPIVINSWFSVIGTSCEDGNLNAINKAMSLSEFSLENPNNVYSLLLSFGRMNPKEFHSQESYDFVARNLIEVDSKNPQVGARLSSCFNNWKKLKPGLREAMKEQVDFILSQKSISTNSFELLKNTTL